MGNFSYFVDHLYPLQDKVIAAINSIETGFYLTGGTALSRGYLHHRLSDDLDYFVNDNSEYSLWVDRITHLISQSNDWKLIIELKDQRYSRMRISSNHIELKLEFINDVPSHIGEIIKHPVLGRLDSPENIFANKITALVSRDEPKDLADIWGFSKLMNMSISEAILSADSKASGIFQADIARVLCSVKPTDWEAVRWIDPPPQDVYISDLQSLGENLLLEGS